MFQKFGTNDFHELEQMVGVHTLQHESHGIEGRRTGSTFFNRRCLWVSSRTATHVSGDSHPRTNIRNTFATLDYFEAVLSRLECPQLHTMTASQFVPRPFSESTMLRCLDLKLGDRSRSGLAGGETLDIEALHRFLASCPMLADLRLSLSRLIEADSTYALNQPFALTCVETISLGFHSCSASFIDMVLDQSPFRSLQKLNLSIGLGVSHGHEVPSIGAGHFRPRKKDFPS